MKRLAIFVSGSGTNMENLVREIQAGHVSGVSAGLVISDKPGVEALERAAAMGVEAVVVDRGQYADKAGFESEIIRNLESRQVDLIALAGFMRILSPGFVRLYKGRLINIHPSLLPAFPGAHGIRDAFEAGVKETGVTVHFVDEGVDTGPIILQRRVPVTESETLESLEAKIHAVEYSVYPEALSRVANSL